MKIAIYGGSFNPPHLAHKQVVEALAKRADKVLVLPAKQSPHKNEPPISGEHRVAMLHLLLDGIKNTTICTRELDRKTPSYTQLTIQEIQTEFPKAKLLLAIGSDQIPELHRWHNFEAWKNNVFFVLALRPGYPAALPTGIQGIAFPIDIALSSTQIREKLERGEDISRYTGEKVADYITAHQIYTPKAAVSPAP